MREGTLLPVLACPLLPVFADFRLVVCHPASLGRDGGSSLPARPTARPASLTACTNRTLPAPECRRIHVPRRDRFAITNTLTERAPVVIALIPVRTHRDDVSLHDEARVRYLRGNVDIAAPRGAERVNMRTHERNEKLAGNLAHRQCIQHVECAQVALAIRTYMRARERGAGRRRKKLKSPVRVQRGQERNYLSPGRDSIKQKPSLTAVTLPLNVCCSPCCGVRPAGPAGVFVAYGHCDALWPISLQLWQRIDVTVVPASLLSPSPTCSVGNSHFG